MKVRLQDIVNQCNGKECWKCEHDNNMGCAITIGGIISSAYIDFVHLCERYPNRQKHYIRMRSLKYENKIARRYKKLR